jgi:hypothetical protein
MKLFNVVSLEEDTDKLVHIFILDQWRLEAVAISTDFRMNSNILSISTTLFQGDMFHKVRHLKMSDTHPFEHKFFKLISQNFPFLEVLYICNYEPQKK